MASEPEPSARDVAAVLTRLARLLELSGANAFKVRAVERGAQTISALGPALGVHLSNVSLGEVPGLGKGLQAMVEEIVATGGLAELSALEARFPKGVQELAAIPAVGTRRALLIFETLGIQSLGELELAAREHRLRALKGVGAATEDRILRALLHLKAPSGRCRLDVADGAANAVLGVLGLYPEVVARAVAGAVRRRVEVVDEVVLVAATAAPDVVAQRLLSTGALTRPIQPDAGRVTFDAVPGVRGVLHLVAPEKFGAALFQHTGTGAFLDATGFNALPDPTAEDEGTMERMLGVPHVPPELRSSGTGLAWVRDGTVDQLVRLEDIRGTLHNHSVATDGRHHLQAMQDAAHTLGWEYLAITEHTPSAFHARGLGPQALLRLRPEIDDANARGGTQLWLGAEVDVLEDGRLDLDDATLAQLDVVLVAIHSQLRMDAHAMTQRLLTAVRHPRVHAVAHLTGRLLLSREPCALDHAAVFAAMAQHQVALEINGDVQRMDPPVELIAQARAAGVRLLLHNDAHRVEAVRDLGYAVALARRAGVRRDEVLNTLPGPQLRAWLARRG